MITLSTIRGRLERRLKDINDITTDHLFEMATDLNQFLYRQIKSRDPERLIVTQTYTVSSSPTSVSLPVDFRDIQDFGTGFFIKDSSGKDTARKLIITGFGSNQIGYYITGNNVVFTGLNTSTTVALRYVPVLADITSLSGSFIVPDEFKDLITEGMVLAYYKNEEDPREGEADQRFARLLADFLRTIKRSPAVYSTSSISQGA